jgi:hypothetical protein
VRHPAPAFAVVDAQALGVARRQSDGSRAGIDQEAHRIAVDRAVGDEMALTICRQNDLFTVGGNRSAAIMHSLREDTLSAVDLHDGAVLLHREHGDAIPFLSDLHRLRIAAVDSQHRRFVADHADQSDLRRYGSTTGEPHKKRNNIGHEPRCHF